MLNEDFTLADNSKKMNQKDNKSEDGLMRLQEIYSRSYRENGLE